MDYIINPWWFYAMQVCGGARIAFGVFGGLVFVLGAVVYIATNIGMYGEPDEDEKRMLNLSKRAAIVGIILTIIAVFAPSTKTLIKMQIAKFGTYDNAEKVLEMIDEKTDALIDAMESDKED